MKFSTVILFLVGFFSVNGFEVEVDSPLSPLYNRTVYSSRITGIGGGVESLIHSSDGRFLMKFLVGTPPTVTYVFVDTGSDLTWIQCKPCITCFTHTTPLFDPKKSATYRNLSCNSPTCQVIPRKDNSVPTCSIPGGECQYYYSYSDTTSTVGVLATETFEFQIGNRGPTKLTDFVFGCGHDNQMSFPARGSSGVIGLGRGYPSLISQLGGSGVEKKFSYCFPNSPDFAGTFKVGLSSSVFVTGQVVSTPLLSHERYPNLYFVTLEGISVGSKRFESQQVMIDKRNVVIDTGSSLTYLERELYTSVISSIRQLINLESVEDSSHLYQLCYSKESFQKHSWEQSLIFHFTGAEVEIKTVNMFVPVYKMMCLSMVPSYLGFNVYGNIPQRNFEVEYNLENNVLSFAPANCSQYPWKEALGSRTATYSALTSFLCTTLVLVLVLILKL